MIINNIRNSIRNKILLATSSVTLCILFISGIILYQFIKSEIEDRIGKQLDRTAESLAEYIETAIETAAVQRLEGINSERLRQLNYINELESTGVITPAEASLQIQERAVNSPMEGGFAVIKSPAGKRLSYTGGISPPVMPDTEPGEFRQILFNGEPYMTHTVVIPYRGWIMVTAVPLKAFKDSIRSDSVRRDILSRRFGTSGYSYIIDTEGYIVVHPVLDNTSVMESKDATGRYFIKELVEKRNGRTYYPWKNPGEDASREKVASHRYIPWLGWIAATSSYIDEIYSPLYTIRAYFVGILTLSLALMILASLWVSSSILNPIKELTRTLKKAETDTSVRMNVRAEDETGELAEIFNSYMEKLEEYQSRLQKDILKREEAEKNLIRSLEIEKVVSDISTRFINTTGENSGTSIIFALERICRTLGSGRVSIFSMVDSKTAKCTYSWSVDGRFSSGERIPMDKSLPWLEKKLKMFRSVHIKSLSDIFGTADTDAEFFKGRGTESFLTIPMSVETEKDSFILFEFFEETGRDIENKTNSLKIFSDIIANTFKRRIWEDSLQSAYDILEKRVDERTEELNEKNKMLENFNRNLEEKVYEETSKLRKQEQLLTQQAKMAAMGEMIGAIAHQWRQPLNALAIIIQDIEEAQEFGELDEAYIKEAVPLAMKQINHMSMTIDDFRNFFRPSKSMERMDVTLAIIEVITLVSSSLNNNMIDINLTSRRGERIYLDIAQITKLIERGMLHRQAHHSIYVDGYPNEFKHVILNIINNSKDEIIHQRKNHGHDYQGLVFIDVNAEGGDVRIAIKDTGGGLPESELTKIFEPYYTTKDTQKGTGIGLYMAKVIIENNMNGKLTARNSSKGAEFIISLKEST
ncbi:cache domain-containing protein [Limisalsivibrio acetivorans]|uniref:cache domain-containing protein n=1 Tax=Limisalsivibrio acetivorans TaxID=1304888 RepID=UPI0003B3D9F8|nr:cache domain-containing protein [Limisalsivibrio acetivorans]